MKPRRSTRPVMYMHLSSMSPFVIKVFATIVLAVCLLSQLASSTEWNELTEDNIGEIIKKLPIQDQARLASTSKAMKEAVDVHMSPKDVLKKTVKGVIRDSAGNTLESFYNIPRKLETMTVPNVPVDYFVMVKSPDNRYARNGRERFTEKLDEMKGTVLTKAESKSREKILLDGESRVHDGKLRMNVYANFHKYSPSEITACINNAYTKIRRECIDGAMTYPNYTFVNLRNRNSRDIAPEYDTLYMVQSCAAYSFMCGISYIA